MAKWCALLLWLATATTAADSVLDPLLTFDLRRVPLRQVIDTIAAQSGMGSDPMMVPEVLRSAPASMAQQFEEKTSLSVTGLPVRAVVRELARVAPNYTLYRRCLVRLGSYRPAKGQAQPGPEPEAAAGPYRVALSTLLREDVRRYAFTYGAPPSRRRLRVELAVEADTELAVRALVGIEPPFALKVDGRELAQQPALPGRASPRWDGRFEAQWPSLEFATPDTTPRRLDLLSGNLLVCDQANEVVLSIDDIARAGVEQKAGEHSATLVRAGPGQVPHDMMNAGRQQQAVTEVELRLTMPRTPLTAQVVQASHCYLPGDEPERLRGQLTKGQGDLGMGGAMLPWLPRIVAKTGSGLREIAITRWSFEPNAPEGRVVLTCVAALDAGLGALGGLRLGLVDWGASTARVPFALRDIALPEPVAENVNNAL